MSRAELLLEVPRIGEVLLEPFKYANGRLGYMCVSKNRKFNITLNVETVPVNLMILKIVGEAKIVNDHLLNKTDMYKIEGDVRVGYYTHDLVTLNKDYE